MGSNSDSTSNRRHSNSNGNLFFNNYNVWDTVVGTRDEMVIKTDVVVVFMEKDKKQVN